MIIELSKDEIINVPVSSKERVHHGRSRKGYNAFLSRYFGKYNLLSDEQKHEMFTSSILTILSNLNYNKYIDSFSTSTAIHAPTVMNVAASLWKSSTREY